MTKKIEITNQHYNGWEPETGIEYTCTSCWEVCLGRWFKYCPQCGVQLIWLTNDEEINEQQRKLWVFERDA